MADSLTKTTTYDAEGCVIRPGEGQKVESGMVLKIRAQDMDGYFSMMEGCIQPKQLLAPHTHQRETQAVFVIKGELEFEVGGEGGMRFTAGTGCYVIKPKGIQHSFWNATDEAVPYIELSTGQNFESFQLTTDSKNKPKVGREADSKFEMKIHFDRIPDMMRQHGLTSVCGMNTGPLDTAAVLDFLKPILK